MPTMDAFGPSIRAMADLLGAKDLRPDPDRSDWDAVRARCDALYAAAIDLRDVLPVGLSSTDEPERLGGMVARMVADGAAVLHLARHPQSTALFRAAEEIARETPLAPLVAEAARDPDTFARLTWAEWLLGHNKLGQGRQVARDVERRGTGLIGQLAGHLAQASAPITSAPSLFTLNGFGLRFHGRRDPRPDGSYIGTRYLTLLFVPVLPIDAWHVRDGHPEGWQFMGKDLLGPITRWWRRLAVAAVLLMVGAGLANRIYNAPERRADRAMAAAEEVARERPDDAMQAWREVVRDFDDERLSSPAAERLLALAAAEVSDPPTVADMAAIDAVVDHQRALPSFAREQTRDQLAGLLLGWAKAIGDGDEPTSQRSIELAARAARIARARAIQDEAEGVRDAGQVTLAGRLAESRPLDAIRVYADVPRPEATAAALDLLDTLGASRSIRAELAPAVEALHVADLDPAVERRLADARRAAAEARAWAADDARDTLLGEGSDADLAAALAADPLDHEVTAELAARKLSAGDVAGARALVEGLGPVGRLTRRAQGAAARVMIADGDISGAEALIERQLADMLPRFERARRAFTAASEKVEQVWIAKARRGDLDPAVMRRLEGATPDAQQRIFGELLSEKMARDPDVAAARAAYTALVDVVPLALDLGGLKLRRANNAEGEQRSRLLGEAEQAFLSIRAEAEGVPTFHLSLGQVYHRLGKAEEGEAEFAGLLARGEPELSMAVVEAYRELGLRDRARAVAEPLVGAGGEVGSVAAITMAIMSRDLDEKARWLGQADQEDAFVRTELISIEADRLMEQGDRVGAERKYAEVARWFEKSAETSSASANNAALAYLRRYGAQADPAHLEAAGRLMRHALDLDPGNGLTITNLVAVLDTLALHRAVARWVPIQRLGLDDDMLGEALEALLLGSKGAEVLAALQASPEVRALLEVAQQAQLLAPKRVSNWEVERTWRTLTRDWAGLHALVGRLKHADFTSAEAEARYAALLAGAEDAKGRELLNRHLDARGQVLAGLPQGADARARAILLTEVALIRLRLASLDVDLPIARQAAAELAEAAKAPGLDLRRTHAKALQLVGWLTAAEAEPAVGAMWKREMRRLGMAGMLPGALDDARVRAALAASPEMQAAARILRDIAGEPDPLLGDWLLARVVGDEPLRAATELAFSSPVTRDRLQIARRLKPYDDANPLLLTLLDAGP